MKKSFKVTLSLLLAAVIVSGSSTVFANDISDSPVDGNKTQEESLNNGFPMINNNISYVTAVGMPYSSFLNEESWAVTSEQNIMTEVESGVYEITYDQVETNHEYEFKFAANGSWTLNWGSGDEDVVLGEACDAVPGGNSIKFTIDSEAEYATVVLQLNLSSWNNESNQGATFKILAVDEEPAEQNDIYLLAGTTNFIAAGWSIENGANPVMTKGSDGIYSCTIENVTAESNKTYQFKVVQIQNGNYTNAIWHGESTTSQNVSFSLSEDCDVTVTYDPSTEEITVTGDGVIPPAISFESIFAVGQVNNNFLNGSSWNPCEDNNKMTEVSDGIYRITFEDVETDDEYCFKFAANGSWDINWGLEGEVIANEATELVYNAYNIQFWLEMEDEEEYADITLQLDLTNLNYTTFEGAVVTVFVGDDVPDPPVNELTITVNNCPNVTITAPEKAKKGQEVTLNVTPNLGYVVKSLKVNNAELLPQNGTYKFSMPNEDVSITAETGFSDNVGARLVGHSVSLDGDIGVNFYIDLDAEIAENENASIRFTIPNGIITETKTIMVSDADTQEIGDNTYYRFKCSVSAKEMTSQIKAQVFVGDTALGTEYTYSVKDYADYLLTHTNDNADYAKAAPLVEKMLTYGAYTKEYFSKTDTLDNIGNVEINGRFEACENSLPDNLFTGATLSLKSQTTLSLFFSDEDELTFSCTYGNNTARPIETVSNGSTQIVRIRDIAACELQSGFKVTVRKGDAIIGAITYSPMNYCYQVINGCTDDIRLINAVKALYMYSEKAIDYSIS